MGRVVRQLFFVGVLFLVLISAFAMLRGEDEEAKDLNVKQFMNALDNGEIKELTMQPVNKVYRIEGTLNKGKKEFIAQVPDNNDIIAQITTKANEQSIAKVEQEEVPSGFVRFITQMIPFLLIGLLLFFVLSRSQGGGGSGGVMNFGKSKAKMYSEDKKKVRFTDVAGADEEKQELVEVVEFLKDPTKFVALGARIPKGVLLVGPPGTGKTLLARAVAGEAGTPFFSISGSDFVEMFVGVGASRVRDLFENAKKNAPCIIFIDEIDAVGRQRGAGVGGGHDEREQTLNQLLVEMDGFGGNEGIILIAATNRPDILDPALLRPGRFDRQIPVNRPDIKGREEILAVHSKQKPFDESVSFRTIAMRTPGFSGADLENLLNEAALVAARHDKKVIDMIDVDEAIDRVIAGPAKKSRVISKKERNIVAYHESGHTVIGMVLDDADTVHKVTIVPRGQAGGYAVMIPKEDRYFMTKPELYDKITGLLGGRVSEEVNFGEVSTGAHNDFERATGIARKMVTEYGMSDKIGPVQFVSGGGGDMFGPSNDKSYSESTAQLIDEEIQDIVKECYERATKILTENKERLVLIAETLLEVETLDEGQIKSLFETGTMSEGEAFGSVEETKTETGVKVKINSQETEEPKPETFDEAKEKADNDYEKSHETVEDSEEDISTESKEAESNEDSTDSEDKKQ